MRNRFPAEWEAQDGVLLGWPHKGTDWKDCLKEIEPVFIEIAKQIAQFEKLVIPCPNKKKVLGQLKKSGVNLDNVLCFEIKTNDTWARDYGFLTVYEENRPKMLNFGFNGWGLKFPSFDDNQINKNLYINKEFSQNSFQTVGLVLEGGSVESDGRGLILTTSNCLLSPNRNPHLSQKKIEKKLKKWLYAKKILWLDHGHLAGDDTDSHIDTLARLCPDHTIVYVSCEDKTDEHYQELQKMKDQLESFTGLEGNPFRLLALPFNEARYDADGNRLPATYANFLVINGAVLVPTYEDKQDEKALKVIQQAYPDRKIIGVNCLSVIQQHGSLHCLTMQIPKGILS